MTSILASGFWWYVIDRSHLGGCHLGRTHAHTNTHTPVTVTEQARWVKTVKVHDWIAKSTMDQTVGRTLVIGSSITL